MIILWIIIKQLYYHIVRLNNFWIKFDKLLSNLHKVVNIYYQKYIIPLIPIMGSM